MAYFLYNIIIHISIIILLPYFFIKMLTARKYRDGIPERFGFVDRAKFKNLPLRNGWQHNFLLIQLRK